MIHPTFLHSPSPKVQPSAVSQQSMVQRPIPQPRFGGKDSYHFDKSQPVIDVPASQADVLFQQLRNLAEKIRTGEYTVRPESGVYNGLRKKFSLKESPGALTSFLLHGTLIVEPTDPNSKIKRVIIHRTRGKKTRKTLTLTIQQQCAPTLRYTHKGGVPYDSTLNKFVTAAANEITKVRRNEQDFNPDLLNNLEF